MLMQASSRSKKRTPRAIGLCALTAVALVMLSGFLTAPEAGCGREPVSAGGGAIAQVKLWEFERFDSDVTVNTDGSLLVRETQVVNFTGPFSFLNRDLTAAEASFDEGRSYGRVRFKDIRVFDLEGEPYEDHEVQNIQGGRRVHINFSALNEQKGWIIQYRMTGAVIYAEDYDRLYYNTVSQQRDVPIKHSRTTVRLPAGTDMDEVKTEVYAGEPVTPTSGRDGDTLWWESGNIPPYAQVTVDVAFPKGIVQVPTVFKPWFGAVMIPLAAVMMFGVAGGMVAYWWSKGRDVSAPELDVVRYEPPGDLGPMEVAYLMNEGAGSSDITASIVDLAIRGKLVITEEEGSGLFKSRQFGFVRRDATVDDLAPYERKVLEGLFESGGRVTESDLKNKFYTHISDILTGLKDQVLGKGLFEGDPSKVKRRYFWMGAALVAIVIALYFWGRSRFDFGYAFAFIPALAVDGLAVIVVGHFMPRRTAKGSQALSYVKGFKEYMATAEREEMKFMTPENFQANLPYAMVLGVADRWAAKFQDIYTSPPEWYRGYPGTTFSTLYLADSLSRMQTDVGSTLASSPSSGGGGGGGFGGGSAGGGFGGGGSSAG